MSSANADAQGAPLAPDSPANVLVVAPARADAVDVACTDLVSGGQPAAENVLLVCLQQPLDQRLEVLRRHGGDLPAEITVVTAGDGLRSTDSTRGGEDAIAASGSTVRTTIVSGPGELSGLGHTIGEMISSWDDGTQNRMCFHSITALLQYADLSRVFRVLHVLTRHVDTVDGVAHYHIDPTAHDAQTLATIETLFDTVIEYEDGDWTGSSER